MHHAIRIRFLTAIVLLSLVGLVQSLYWYSTDVKCNTVGNGGSVAITVCGYVMSRTCVLGSCSGGADRDTPMVVVTSGSDVPSAAAGSDVPTPSSSDIRREVQYSFVEAEFEGKEYLGLPDTTVIVSLTMDYECAVQVNYEACASCSYCGKDQYTVDCTNVLGGQGRTTECEVAAVNDERNSLVTLFYPLTGEPMFMPGVYFPPPSPAPTALATAGDKDFDGGEEVDDSEGDKEIDDGGEEVDNSEVDKEIDDGGDEVDDSEGDKEIDDGGDEVDDSDSSWPLLLLCWCL
jgi:hypothetical protein